MSVTSNGTTNSAAAYTTEDIARLTGLGVALAWEDLDAEDRLGYCLRNRNVQEWMDPDALQTFAAFRTLPQWHQILGGYYTLHGNITVLEKAVDRLIADTRAQEKTLWSHGQTAAAFLAQDEPDVAADARDLLVPGCITILAAPRASGKSIVALALALALAQGGIFRDEQVPKRRVALVDRDNSPALIRKRLRWLGAQEVTGLTVFTRDKAPPLTDAAAWAAFPVEHFEVVIVDSIGAATEGVSEKEGKQTQLFLATLKDLAFRGPAVLGLDNTNKAALNYRGRGEKGDAVDILYECRNITGWTPAHGGDWWATLPDFGEHTWQERASRRTGQQVLRVAFIPSKFRGGMDPEPFCLEIDTRQAPWTLTDCTEALARAGEQAAQDHTQQERQKLVDAGVALCQAIRTRPPECPMLKYEAEAFLCALGLKQKVARTFLTTGGNHDVYPQGQWVLREVPRPHGKGLGVYLAGEQQRGHTGEEDRNENKPTTQSPSNHAVSEELILVDGPTPHNENTTPMKSAETLAHNWGAFSSEPGCYATTIDPSKREHLCAPQQGGYSRRQPPCSNGVGDEEPCLHEHVDTLGVCNDCGQFIEV